MGCGQSKIQLYPRKSKSNKTNGKKRQNSLIDDKDEEDHQQTDREKQNKCGTDDPNNLISANGKESPELQNNEDLSVSFMLRAKNLSLLQNQHISNSQQNFFRMIEQKIEDGPDYDSTSETEMALEEARRNTLIQHWESASLSASLGSSATNRSLHGTPVRQSTELRQPNVIIPMHHPAMMIPSDERLNVDIIYEQTEKYSNSPIIGHHQQHHHQQQQQQQQLQHQPQQLQQHLQHQQLQQQQQQQLQQQQPQLLPQSVIHQTYGIAVQQQPPPPPHLTVSSRLRNSLATSSPSSSSIGVAITSSSSSTTPPSVMTYPSYPPQSYYGDVYHTIQVPPSQQQQQIPTEPRFPPTISVQRLAPQVQRQIRETQELIKDSCTQLYAAGYGSPGPPMRTMVMQPPPPTSSPQTQLLQHQLMQQHQQQQQQLLLHQQQQQQQHHHQQQSIPLQHQHQMQQSSQLQQQQQQQQQQHQQRPTTATINKPNSTIQHYSELS